LDSVQTPNGRTVGYGKVASQCGVGTHQSLSFTKPISNCDWLVQVEPPARASVGTEKAKLVMHTLGRSAVPYHIARGYLNGLLPQAVNKGYSRFVRNRAPHKLRTTTGMEKYGYERTVVVAACQWYLEL